MPKKITADGEIVDDVQKPLPRILADEMLRSEYTPFWKTPYNHDTTAEALRTATSDFEPTLAQQNTAEETDINSILRRFGINNVRAQLAAMPPSFIDVPENMDMATAIELVRQGEEAFMQLSADARAMFGNDLARYVAHVDDRLRAKDYEALDKLGLDVKAALEAANAAKAEAATRAEAEFNAKVAKATKPEKKD